MSRIRKVPREEWDPELRAMTLADEATPLEQGLMRMMANAPRLARPVARFGGELFANRTLSRRLIELVRLRVAFHNQCRSCMAIRYRSAIDDGLDEGAVCSLERPEDAPDLSEAEKAAIRYADLAATNHFAISDATFDDLRAHFSEAEIVELGIFVAFFIGFGRLGASWDMLEELPDGWRDKSETRKAPWTEDSVVVRG